MQILITFLSALRNTLEVTPGVSFSYERERNFPAENFSHLELLSWKVLGKRFSIQTDTSSKRYKQ